MEFFSKGKTVKFRSHLDKYLIADQDEKTVHQSRNVSSPRANWTIEFVDDNSHLVRIKSCYGRYLTASDVPFLLGMTGKKVLQLLPDPDTKLDSSMEWEPIRDGFQVKFRTRAGKFLRANGGTPPWRNSITHDAPYRTATQDWVLWDIEVVEKPGNGSLSGYQSQLSGFSSFTDGADDSPIGSQPNSPWSTPSIKSHGLSANRIAMELFHNAKAVRLKSHHEKYLLAEEDEETVSQDRNGSSRSVRWTVEFVDDCQAIRLKSCYGKYLTASNSPFLLGMTGRKVLQTLPRRLDSSVEWEPVREGFQVKLKTRYGNFLRANGGLPPWRNSITHDIPHRTATQDWIVWDVDIVEIQIKSPDHQSSPPPKHAPQSDSTTPQSDSTTPDSIPSSPSSESFKSAKLSSIPSSPISGSFKSRKLSKQESKDSFVSAHSKPDGRIIYFKVADDNGNADIGIEGPSIIFKGNGLDELTRVLEEETGLEDIIICSLSPLNGKLYPLRLHLPPNNTTMNVVVVKASSKVARDFAIK